MGINGRTISIAVGARGAKDLDEFETFAPNYIDLRNGRLTDAGNFIKRPGFAPGWSTAVGQSVELLIPEDTGYAVTSKGNVYKLGDNIRLLSGSKLCSRFKPQWARFGDMIIVCGGDQPIKIQDNKVSVFGNTDIRARFINRISSYVIFSGGMGNEWLYSTPGNPEGEYSINTIQEIDDGILNTIVLRDKIYHFRRSAIEVWVFIGGSIPFVRNDAIGLTRGLGAPDSVVQANNTIYWLSSDGDFYVLDGGVPKIISGLYTRGINEPGVISDIYGYEYQKERLIKWFAPTIGKCFVYDYAHDIFSEDNTWDNGQWGMMPVAAYMELGGKQYIGDYTKSGKVFKWSTDYKTDNGKHIRVYRKFTVKPSQAGNKVRFNRLNIRVKRGVELYAVDNLAPLS